MITKRNGNGQTECRGCKEKGKFALNWDSFLYNFNNKPYCFDCLMEKLELLQQENQQLKENNLAMQEEMARTWAKHDKLKATLEEIREYIKHEWFKRGQLGIVDKSFQEWELNNLLQIIDKGFNNE